MTIADAQTVDDLVAAVPAEHRALFVEFVQARADAKNVREMSARLDAARSSMRAMEAGWGANVAAGEKARRQQTRLAELETENKSLGREIDSLKERLRADQARIVVLSKEADIARAARKRLGATS